VNKKIIILSFNVLLALYSYSTTQATESIISSPTLPDTNYTAQILTASFQSWGQTEGVEESEINSILHTIQSAASNDGEAAIK
jgi:hypothetical protein